MEERETGKGMETASKPVAENRFFQHLSSGLIFGQPFPENCNGVEELTALGVSWIIWHPSKAEADMQSRVDRVLHSCLGTPQTFGDRKVFNLK